MEEDFFESISWNSPSRKLTYRPKLLEKLPIGLNSNIGSIKSCENFDDMEDLKEALALIPSEGIHEIKSAETSTKFITKMKSCRILSQKSDLPPLNACSAALSQRQRGIRVRPQFIVKLK